MKRTEREYAKAKKRGDLLQKEKEAGRSEMIKVTGARDKLDKLSRNMAEENKKLRVSSSILGLLGASYQVRKDWSADCWE